MHTGRRSQLLTRRWVALPACVGVLVLGGWRLTAEDPAPTSPRGPDTVRYARDVRRILSDRCFQCHGPDTAARKAELRLDDRDSATTSRNGKAAIVAGNPDASELIRRIESHDPDDVMPPSSAHKRPLSDDEKGVLRRWIAEGAAYEPHWAFTAPSRPPVPSVSDDSWCENEIDAFILASLERRSVRPSPPADKATLARRVYLDLTGLPPTPEEIAAFVADTSESAYESLVDRLLNEEPSRSRVAERLAAPWLDGARYADTCGIHMDAGRQIWPWRDWVLRAFRDNMPFDRFLVAQLAGDLVPNATMDDRIASGFNRLHVTTDEGGAIAEEYLVEYAVDRVSATSSVFLGLTAGCARCHDHKYDPITMEDFYGLYAFFNSIDEPGLYSQLPDPNRAPEPFIDVPTPEHAAALADLTAKIDAITAAMNSALPGEGEGFATFRTETIARAGAQWSRPQVLGATSTFEKVILTPNDDGSIQASGPIPDAEDYVVLLKTDQANQRVLLLEALASPPEAGGTSRGAGRMPHGNTVLTGITLETRPAGSNAEWQRVPFRWAWADVTQEDRDFSPVYLLDGMQPLGWAADGNEKAGERLLAFLADEPFGGTAEAPETELRVTLAFQSPFAQHSMGRVRFHVGSMTEEGIALLPTSSSRWQLLGPFPADSAAAAYERSNGPETATSIDLKQNFGAGNQYWRFDQRLADERNVALADGLNASYLGRMIWSPSDRELDVALGTDDGFQLFVNGVAVAERRVNRSLTPGEDRVRIPLRKGPNSFVLKVINTGGPAAYWYGQIPAAVILEKDLLFTVFPREALGPDREDRLASAWRRTYFPAFRDAEAQRAALVAERTAVQGRQPRTMVMRELPEPRPTFVLTRGQYDKPDRSRPVARAIPKAFGTLLPDAPQNRLGLAQWMIAADNPLVARVAVNRLWEIAFGAGLVRTSEDFGQQGEWPTHPELLDWLAVDFREHGWDMRRMLRKVVTSATYRQASVVRGDLSERDPDNRLLGYYPRRRLSAEQIRDQALYVAGILVEKLGGPSVKPYQPAGLWQEVSMPQSNTRAFEQGSGDDLWRRSIYTYWKRACPPPSLQTFDAPTREACVIRRPSTNTPLQALVLWNDVQYVEAARSLAERTLRSAPDSDTARVHELFVRCTGRVPEADEARRLLDAIAAFRSRYQADPEGSSALVRTGNRPVADGIPPAELAAWTMVASAVLNLHETITQD